MLMLLGSYCRIMDDPWVHCLSTMRKYVWVNCQSFVGNNASRLLLICDLMQLLLDEIRSKSVFCVINAKNKIYTLQRTKEVNLIWVNQVNYFLHGFFSYPWYNKQKYSPTNYKSY